jgi:hypothetical protein
MSRFVCTLFGLLAFFCTFATGDDARPARDEPVNAGPLQMRLIANQNTYRLDLGGRSPEEFRRFLCSLKPDDDRFPPSPAVDLVLEIANTSNKTVTIWVGGDDTLFILELKGSGAVSKIVTMRTTADLKRSRPVEIAPGKSYRLPITNLNYPYPRVTERWYWTEPGEYTLSARYRLGWSADPFGGPKGQQGQKLTAAPIKLVVIEPLPGGAVSDYLTADGKLKHALVLHSGRAGGPDRPRGTTIRIEPSGEWEMTNSWGLAPASVKGKLSREQLAAMAKQLDLQDFLGLPANLRGRGFIGDAGFAEPFATLSFGDKTTHVAGRVGANLDPKADPLAAPRAKDELGRFSTLVQVVQSVARPAAVRELKELHGVKATKATMPATGFGDPVVFSSIDELARRFQIEDARLLQTQVDFATEKLLWFAWVGSRFDRLSFEVHEGKNGYVVAFERWESPTEERHIQNSRFFVVPKHAKWTVLGVGPARIPGGKLPPSLPLEKLGSQKHQQAATYSGLIRQGAAKMLTPVAKGEYAVGLISDADTFARFATAAGLTQKMDIDWQKQAVVCVVLQLNTNRLTFRQWNGPKDGVGELIIQWSGIEPLWGGRFLAVLHRVDKKDLKKVVVKVLPGRLLTELDCSGWHLPTKLKLSGSSSRWQLQEAVRQLASGRDPEASGRAGDASDYLTKESNSRSARTAKWSEGKVLLGFTSRMR